MGIKCNIPAGVAMTSKSWKEWTKAGAVFPVMDYKPDGTPKGPDMTSLDNIRYYLSGVGKKLAYNALEKRVELYEGAEDDGGAINWEPVKGWNPKSYPMELREEIRQRLGVKVKKSDIIDCINAIAWGNSYNPVTLYLDSCTPEKWDGRDRIQEIIDMIELPLEKEPRRPYYADLLRYALYQSYAMAYNDGSRAAQYCLVFQGPQGIGKTTLVQALAPRDLVITGAYLNPRSKDNIMTTTSAWVVEVGEAGRSLSAVDDIKAFITQRTDRFRAPYARTDTIQPRYTTYYMTTNDAAFLLDGTGNRRFAVIPMAGMTEESRDRLRHYNETGDTYQLWCQVAGIAKAAEEAGFYEWWHMPPALADYVRTTAESYRIANPIEQLLKDCYDYDGGNTMPGGQWLTASKIANILIDNYKTAHGVNSQKVGRVLQMMAERGEAPAPKKPTNHMTPTLYYLPPLRNYALDQAREKEAQAKAMEGKIINMPL